MPDPKYPPPRCPTCLRLFDEIVPRVMYDDALHDSIEYRNQVAALKKEVHELKRIQYGLPDPDRVGECLYCDFEYDIANRTDHCADCGTCWDHCDNHFHRSQRND